LLLLGGLHNDRYITCEAIARGKIAIVIQGIRSRHALRRQP
jgi:hypothetical protein